MLKVPRLGKSLSFCLTSILPLPTISLTACAASYSVTPFDLVRLYVSFFALGLVVA